MAYTTIKNPSDYFNTVLYTGNGATNAITGVNFQPDLIWIKDRDTAGNSHIWTDSVRGNTKNIYSNLTNAEGTKTDRVTSFDTDGFTLGADASQGANDNGSSQVAWNWLANGAGVANTDGSISSTVSANTTSGFSIVKYSGDGGSSSTVGHGLGAIPKMVIIKCRTSTPSWQVWGDGYTRLSLNNTDGDLGSNGMTRGASTVTLPSGINDWNGSGQDYIMYCWSEVQGYSKFGSYTGNGSTDGTFVYTGFKPAFLIVKRTDSTSNWRLWDSTRSTFNVADKLLFPDTSDQELTSSSYYMDLLSSGFKIRNTNADINASGGSYIYMAFASEPLVGDNPATAR